MKLARVIGQVVSSVKDKRHEGRKLLLTQPVDVAGRPQDSVVLAIDCAQAGVGDYVLVLQEGKSARQVMDHPTAPCEAIVVGVIDTVQVNGRQGRLVPPVGNGKK